MFNHTNQPLITSFYIRKLPIFCRNSDESALIRNFLRNGRVRVKTDRIDFKSGTTSQGNIKEDRYVLLPIPNLKKIYQFTNYFIMGDVISMVLIFFINFYLLVSVCSNSRRSVFFCFPTNDKRRKFRKKIFKNMNQEMDFFLLYLIKASKNTIVRC